jgi:hypothetical protein
VQTFRAACAGRELGSVIELWIASIQRAQDAVKRES